MANGKTEARLTKVVTGKVRLSYVHIWEPKAISPTSDPKYSVSILIPKTDKEQIVKIKAAIEAAKKEGMSLWGGKLPAGLMLPLRDGDTDRPDQEEYQGMYFINASAKQRPGVVDRDCNPIVDKSEVYSGVYARVSVNFYAFNKGVNKGVACGLQNVQKLQDGPAFGSISRPEDDFKSALEDFEDDDVGGLL